MLSKITQIWSKIKKIPNQLIISARSAPLFARLPSSVQTSVAQNFYLRCNQPHSNTQVLLFSALFQLPLSTLATPQVPEAAATCLNLQLTNFSYGPVDFQDCRWLRIKAFG